MATPRLSTHSLRELIRLFDQSRRSFVGTDEQRLRGVAAWDIHRHTSLSPAETHNGTTCVGYSDCYPVAFRDERVLVDLEEDDDHA